MGVMIMTSYRILFIEDATYLYKYGQHGHCVYHYDEVMRDTYDKDETMQYSVFSFKTKKEAQEKLDDDTLAIFVKNNHPISLKENKVLFEIVKVNDNY